MNAQKTVQAVHAAALDHYNDAEMNHIIHLGIGSFIKFVWLFASTENRGGLEHNPDRILGVPIKVHPFKWELVRSQKINRK